MTRRSLNLTHLAPATFALITLSTAMPACMSVAGDDDECSGAACDDDSNSFDTVQPGARETVTVTMTARPATPNAACSGMRMAASGTTLDSISFASDGASITVNRCTFLEGAPPGPQREESWGRFRKSPVIALWEILKP